MPESTEPREPREWTYLRRARIRAQHSPTSLAHAAGYSITYICQVEAGARGVSDEGLHRLADALAVDAAELDSTRPPIPSRGRLGIWARRRGVSWRSPSAVTEAAHSDEVA